MNKLRINRSYHSYIVIVNEVGVTYVNIIGKSVIRKDAFEKVTGRAKYTGDELAGPTLHARMVISPYGHAKIVSIDVTKAKRYQESGLLF